MHQVASCTYYQYGAGGKQSGLNALCILGLNIIIDKVYLVIWFWYILLIVCGVARIIVRWPQQNFHRATEAERRASESMFVCQDLSNIGQVSLLSDGAENAQIFQEG